MKPSDHERLLESIARLTEKRDRESLELCLMQTMFELLSVEEITLYQIEGTQFGLLVRINPEGCWNVDDEMSDPEYLTPVADDALFADCLQKRRMQVDASAGRMQRYAFPILHQGRGVGVLCLETIGDLADDRRLIAGFLRIYQNYLGLIHENAHDKLTGLLNRKTFDERLITIFLNSYRTDPTQERSRHMERRQLEGTYCHWLAVLDVDHFKRVNDTFGHLYGDEVLLLLANLMRQCFRRSDLLFRYGGEEFVVVLKTPHPNDTWSVLDRFRQTVALHHFPQVGQVTISMGFTQVGDSEMPTTIVERADRALYYAKGHGRNQIQNYEQLIQSGALDTPQSQSGGDIEMF